MYSSIGCNARVLRESDGKYLVYAPCGGGMMGILAYETFIGWNVLRPGARAMGSVTLLLRILNHPRSLSPGLALTLPPCRPHRGRWKSYIRVYTSSVSRAKRHVGIKSKTVFLVAEPPPWVTLLEGSCLQSYTCIVHRVYICASHVHCFVRKRNIHFCLRERPEAI